MSTSLKSWSVKDDKFSPQDSSNGLTLDEYFVAFPFQRLPTKINSSSLLKQETVKLAEDENVLVNFNSNLERLGK